MVLELATAIGWEQVTASALDQRSGFLLVRLSAMVLGLATVIEWEQMTAKVLGWRLDLVWGRLLLCLLAAELRSRTRPAH